jgi:cysteine desulfurase
MGLKTAFEKSYEHLDKERAYVSGLKSRFIEQITRAVPGVEFNGLSGDMDRSTYTLVNVRLPFDPAKSQLLLFHLDLNGIACSKGSACQSGSDSGSHVLNEILDEKAQGQPSLRFSFSHYNTEEEVDYVVGVLEGFANS